MHGRDRSGSICVRDASIIRPNGTCDGQTSSHARQTRQRSMNRANVSSVAARPSCTARIAVMRPRGDADSSPGQPVRGAMGEAQTAGDAGVQVRLRRRVTRRPVRRRTPVRVR